MYSLTRALRIPNSSKKSLLNTTSQTNKGSPDDQENYDTASGTGGQTELLNTFFGDRLKGFLFFFFFSTLT